MTGLIYKYTNKIDGKIYIGQTRTSLKKRHQKHITEAKSNAKSYFDRALHKYGASNFTLEVIEDGIPYDQLDTREKYWIDVYDSFYKHGHGYNMTQGGKWSSGTQILTMSQANQIKKTLETTNKPMTKIAKEWDVSIYCISDINTGDSFIDIDRKYPIRTTYETSDIDDAKAKEIISALTDTNERYEIIAKKFNVKYYTVMQLNRGINSHCPKNLSYPIRKPDQPYTYQNKINQQDVISICWYLIHSNISLNEIATKFGIAKNTVVDISRGIAWKNVTNQFMLPIRKNATHNTPIFDSIYGIVYSPT